MEIAACTRAGCGPASLPVSIRTLDALASRPIDLHFPYVNSTSVALEWSVPRYPNGVVGAYRVRYTLKRVTSAKPAWQNVYVAVNGSADRQRVEIGGLLKMEYYIFEVSANNSAGMGWGEAARSVVYTIDTLTRKTPDTPARPSISKSSVKANELTISWTTSADNYSPIRYFHIQMCEDAVTNRTAHWRTIFVYKCANSNLNNNYRLTIKGVDKRGEHIIRPNGHLYKFRIASANDIGTSEFSDESNTIRSKYDLPRANLANLTARVIDLTRVMLLWDEAALPDDALVKFKVCFHMTLLATSVGVGMNLSV